jgi:DNA-binding CsgD family transcriptional regulator
MNSRSLKMLYLRSQGKSVKDIARFFAVSIRTVQRALAEHREGEGVLNG